MRCILLLIFCLLGPLFGEAPSFDSLRAALPSQQGQERLASLLELANRTESRLPQAALAYSTEGLALARQFGDREKESTFLNSMAFCYCQLGDFALAIQLSKESLALGEKIANRERIAKAHNTLGITYTYMGRYSQSLEEHLESLRIREELSLETASIQSLNNIGVLYHNIGQYEQAIATYEQIRKRLQQTPDSSRLILVKLNIGFAQYKLGRLQEALANHQEAMALIEKNQNKTMLAYAWLNLGITCTDLKRFREAKQYLDLALAEYAKQDQKHGRLQVLNALGRLHLLNGTAAQGIPPALEAADLAQRINAQNYLMVSYELLSDLYRTRGDQAASYNYFKQFVATRDAIYSSQESKKLAEVMGQVVTLRMDHEIQTLQKEKIIAALKLQKNRYVASVLLAGLGFLLGIAGLLVNYGNRMGRNQQMVATANADLQRLNQELQQKVQELRILGGLLPICAHCKKIRNDAGYWQQLEGYLSEHSAATFTHGICPNCADQLFPGATSRAQARAKAH